MFVAPHTAYRSVIKYFTFKTREYAWSSSPGIHADQKRGEKDFWFRRKDF